MLEKAPAAPLSPEMAEWIKAMPKIDLHYHLEGGVRPETMAGICKERGLSAAECDCAYIRHRLEVGSDCASLNEFLEKFDYILPLLRSPWALEQAAEAAVYEAAEQNIIYLEVRFTPGLLATERMDAGEVIRHVLVGLEAGERRWGVPTGAILSLALESPAEENLALVEAALALKDPRLVGVDVAGPEAELPLRPHAAAIRRARAGGLAVTLHAGEAGPPENIAEAVFLGAARIGHATSLYQNPTLLAQVVEREIGLELCPTSNLQTKAIRSWEEYHIRDYLAAGAKATVCTDDPAISGITLEGEYRLAAERFGLERKDLLRLVRSGIDMAFCPAGLKAWLREQVDHFEGKE